MTKIALLRSLDVGRLSPYVGEIDSGPSGTTLIKVFYNGETCGPPEFCYESERLEPNATCDDIVDKIQRWGADGVISLSWPDENALRDAIVGEILRENGTPMVMHDADVTSRLANKWETRAIVQEFGLSVPAGMLLDGDLLNGRAPSCPAYRTLIERKAFQLGYPLLVKPLWEYGGHGIRFIRDATAMVGYLNCPSEADAVLEQCINGQLCSVEIIGCEDNYVTQPLIWKGATGGTPSAASERARISAPMHQADTDFRPVAQRLRQLCAGVGVRGAIEVEMIYSERSYKVIEINPRTSGTTVISTASSGCNTIQCLLSILQGNWSPTRARALERHSHCALQIPVHHFDSEKVQRTVEDFELVRAINFTMHGTKFSEILIRCPVVDATTLATMTASLHSRPGFHPTDSGERLNSLLTFLQSDS